MQLMELDVPMVLALNMMDEVRGNGGHIRVNDLEEALGIPVVPISASKNEGVGELVEHAVHIAKYRERPGRKDFCDKEDHGGAVHRCLHGIMHLIEDKAAEAGIPVRFAASKLVEGDSLIKKALKLAPDEAGMVEQIIKRMEKERGLDRQAAIADMRFSFIKKLCDEAVVKPAESKEHERSQKIDKLLTGKYTAIPIFVLIMCLVFYLTFNVVGAWLQDGLSFLIDGLAEVVSAHFDKWNVNSTVQSLVVDAILGGVGSVVSFVPIIVTLFFFLSMLEDSGYMARVAFVMDKLLRKLGLSGRSIVPMLIGFGCTVPGVMAARTLPSERDRKMTILLTPFMSCSAKLPIYGFFADLFFGDKAWVVMIALYVLGILVGIVTAYLFKKTIFKGEPVPFVMELPNYRIPGAKNVLHLLWDKARDFLQRAFTIIFIATIVVWLLQTFDFTLTVAENPETSILAGISGLIAPLLVPLGLNDYRFSTALITGFLAKESVVSTLKVLFGGEAAVRAAMTGVSASALLVFCLLYTPCVAAVASVKRELGRKYALFMVVFQCAVAWVCAALVNLIGNLIF